MKKTLLLKIILISALVLGYFLNNFTGGNL